MRNKMVFKHEAGILKYVSIPEVKNPHNDKYSHNKICRSVQRFDPTGGCSRSHRVCGSTDELHLEKYYDQVS